MICFLVLWQVDAVSIDITLSNKTQSTIIILYRNIEREIENAFTFYRSAFDGELLVWKMSSALGTHPLFDEEKNKLMHVF